MAGRPRTALGGLAVHVMNRVSGRQALFEDGGETGAGKHAAGRRPTQEEARRRGQWLLPPSSRPG